MAEDDTREYDPDLPHLTLDQLFEYRGRTDLEPVYVAVDGIVFDVTEGKLFYGPGGPYHVFAGRDCTRALAIGSTDVKDCVGDTRGLAVSQMMAIDDWLDSFESKYVVVAKLAKLAKL